MYESAQKIYAYLLGEVWNRFNLLVVPGIKEGGSKLEVDELIQDKVIGPVLDLIPENVFDLYPPHITGMLFFLTGTCHVKWER